MVQSKQFKADFIATKTPKFLKKLKTSIGTTSRRSPAREQDLTVQSSNVLSNRDALDQTFNQNTENKDGNGQQDGI